MATCLILDNEIHDPEPCKDYLPAAPEFVKKPGGEYLVRGGDFEVLVGGCKPEATGAA